MSEQLSTQPQAIHTEIAGREIAIVEASNGQQRYYEVDAEGNKTRMSNQEFGAIAKTEENAQDTALFGRINEAIDNGSLNEFSAGADYRNATGLSREQVMARGHKGYKEVVEAAKDHKAAQETAAATKQAERAERRERLETLLAGLAVRNENKARGRVQAEAWQIDVDAVREAAKPASKKLSYRDKLLAGGELGVVKMAADEQKAKEHAAHNRVITVAQPKMSAEAKATAKAVKAAQKQAGANLEITPASSYKEQLETGGSAGVKKIGGVIRAQKKAEQPKKEQKGYDPKSGMTYREWLLAGGELSQKSTKASVQTGEKINQVDIAKLQALGGVAAGIEAFKALKVNKPEGANSEDVSGSAESLLNEDGVLDLDGVERVQDATQSPVAGEPAPVPAVRPIHRPATRPNTQPRRRGVRGLVAAGVATIAALGVWAGFSNHSGESMAAAIGMSQPKDGSGVADKNGKGHELSPETIAAARKQAAKLRTEAELYKNQTEVTGASGETATTKPLERGSNPWDEARKMLESYDLPTTDANINAVDKAIQKRMGQIDYTRMSVGMQVPWFGEDRVRQILGDYDNTTPGK